MAEYEPNGVSKITGTSNKRDYEVKQIKRMDEIVTCNRFDLKHFNWTTTYQPETYGQMGLLDKCGLILSMTVMEKNPLRRYYHDDEPVYKDSAVEAFINFMPGIKEVYCNFEMNANGALLSEFGLKSERVKIKEISSYKGVCKAFITENTWCVILQIPMELICDLYQVKPLKKGDSFTFNMYKISEDKRIEHYASYAPVSSNTPNFHLPEFFKRAVIL